MFKPQHTSDFTTPIRFFYSTKSSELTDHLGNVRATFQQVGIVPSGTVTVTSWQDYYAFGSVMPGRHYSAEDYAYGYQGQEDCAGPSKWKNFELRQLNTDLGRWMAPDPYGQFHSPYVAMGNIPNMGVDPDGGYAVPWPKGNQGFFKKLGIWIRNNLPVGPNEGEGIATDDEWGGDFTGGGGGSYYSGTGSGSNSGYEGGTLTASSGGGSGSALIYSSNENPGYNTTPYDPTAGNNSRWVRDKDGKLTPKMADGSSLTPGTSNPSNQESKPVPPYADPNFQTNGDFDPAKYELAKLMKTKAPATKEKFASGGNKTNKSFAPIGGGQNTPGGNWDFWGVGSVPYQGKAIGGTNFIGPGPNEDPASLGLKPIDEIDFGAYVHDMAYYRNNTGGYSGAKHNLKVAFADLQLVNLALSIMDRYHQGGIDQITGKPISQRTYNISTAVFIFFEPIVREKYLQLGTTPNIQYPWLGK